MICWVFLIRLQISYWVALNIHRWHSYVWNTLYFSGACWNLWLIIMKYLFFFPVALCPNAGHGPLIIEVSKSRSKTHTHTHTNTMGKTPLIEWSACRRYLELTTLPRGKHPCPPRNWNPQSQQASGRRPTPKAAWPLGRAIMAYRGLHFLVFWGGDKKNFSAKRKRA